MRNSVIGYHADDKWGMRQNVGGKCQKRIKTLDTKEDFRRMQLTFWCLIPAKTFWGGWRRTSCEAFDRIIL